MNISSPIYAPEPNSIPIQACPPIEHRVHHSYIWLGSLRTIGMLLFVIIVMSASAIIQLMAAISEMSAASEQLGFLVSILFVVFMIFIICGLIFGIHAWSYYHLYYVIGDEEFSLYSGILTKRRVHVPYQKIQSIDQKASLLQRLFGVCNVVIDTAGGASNKAILVPYLTKQQADALRFALFSRKDALISPVSTSQQGAIGSSPAGIQEAFVSSGENGRPTSGNRDLGASSTTTIQGNVLDIGERAWNEFGGVFAGQPIDTGKILYEYQLSNKELFLTGLSNSTSFAIAIIIVISVVLQLLSGIFEIVPASEDALFDTFASSTAAYGTEVVVVGMISFIVGIAIIVWLVSGVSACVSFGGFRAIRRNDRIEVERGLLQHQTQSVNIERIQSVIVKQSFIRRLMGYCQLSLGKVDAQGSSSSSSSDASSKNTSTGTIIIHPFVKTSRVSEILNGLVPEFPPVTTEARQLPTAALRRGLFRECFWQCGAFWLLACALAFQAVLQAMISDYSMEYTMLLSAGYDVLDLAIDADDVVMLQVISGVLWALCVVGILGMIFAAVRTVLWYRGSSFAFNQRFTRITNNGFSIESVTFPKSKIQFGYVKTNPFQRVAHTATLNARTAAGIGGTTIKLIDVTEDDATAWLSWLE